MRRRDLFVGGVAALASAGIAKANVAGRTLKDVLLFERVGPTVSQLFIANADGSAERPLLADPAFEYHASFAPGGDRVAFTSERRGRGQADLYIARLDGSAIRPIAATDAVEDVAAISPDGRRVAFTSTRNGGRSNIWVMDIASGRAVNLTGSITPAVAAGKPDGFFRPAWSPDGKWIAFSSDRLTDWQGHACTSERSVSCSGPGVGWEHVQELSIYVAPATGGVIRRVASRPGFSAGSPRWSGDGRRIVFYELSTLDTWNARIPHLALHATSQITSVDVASGERVVHTSGPGVKLFPQFLSKNEIGYQVRAGGEEGLYFTGGRPMVKLSARSPAWSPDGRQVVYEKATGKPLPQNTPMFGWDQRYDYRSTESFPRISRDGQLVVTEQSRVSSLVVSDADGGNRRTVFDAAGKGMAFQPCWSPDGAWIYFGLGLWFENRATNPARIMRIRRDGAGLEALTDGKFNAGFPSCSPDGARLVFRQWTPEGAGGLQIIDIASRAVTRLTDGYDNLPDWSPDGRRIVFTRRLADGNFDIFTIAPDGTDLQRLTTSGANDAHAVWTYDGRLLWTSGYYGFKDEAALYDNNFQPYGQIWTMNADGTGKRSLTDSIWEDGEAMLIPALLLAKHR